MRPCLTRDRQSSCVTFPLMILLRVEARNASINYQELADRAEKRADDDESSQSESSKEATFRQGTDSRQGSSLQMRN